MSDGGSKTRPRGLVDLSIVGDFDPESLDYDLTGDENIDIARLANLLSEIAAGVHAARVVVSLGKVTPGANTTQNGAELPSIVVTINHGSLANNDVLYIGPETIVWKTVPSASNEADIKSSAATDATELAAVINSYAGTKNLVTATANSPSSGQVTIQSKIPGRLGRFLVGANDVSAQSIGGAEQGDGFKQMDDAVSNTYVGIGTAKTYSKGV